MRWLPLWVVVCSLTIPAVASAFDDELQVGGDVRYRYEGSGAGHGAGASVRLRYGLTDAVAIATMGSWTYHPTPAAQFATLGVGLIYALDVFRVVPYFGLLVGGGLRYEDGLSGTFVLDVVGGFDVLWTRTFSTGLELTYQLLVGRDLIPGTLLVSIRMSWHHLM